MTDEISPLERRLLLVACDGTWRRKPDGYSSRTVTPLVRRGLLEAKRERGRLGSSVVRTMIRRTELGRQALGLPPLNPAGES